MQTPTQRCQAAVKLLLRYLAGTRRAVYYLKLQPGRRDRDQEVWVDASWGSDIGRRSTSGGILYCGGMGMTHWSRTQSVVTTSSCEAELLAISAGAQEGLLLQTLWEELGETVKLTIFTDSKAAVDWISKKGAGRLKHIQLRQF